MRFFRLSNRKQKIIDNVNSNTYFNLYFFLALHEDEQENYNGQYPIISKT